jgi:PHD/YefM family antitoxin component YafN of YafNO toxin-antitoxin module
MPQGIDAIHLRHNLGEILDQVANNRERFLVQRAGIPAAIILSVPDYEDLEDLVDTYYEQQDPAFQRSLAAARADITAGNTATLAALHRDLQVKEPKERRPRKRP